MQSDESSGRLREPEITLCFSLEPSLEFEMRVLGRVKELQDARESAAGGCGASLDGLVGAVEVVPGERLDVGAQNKVGVALPNFELMLLSGADSAADDLKDVRWSAALPILEANRNADDVGGAHLASGAGWNLGDQTAIGQVTSSNLYRFEQARECAASADRFAQISMRKDYGLSVGQIRCDHGHGNLEIFEAPRFENLLDEVTQAVIAGQPKPGNSPSGDVAETERSASSNDARERRTAGISRTEDAADARAGDKRDGDAILLENLQHAEMGESPSKPAA
jgi:hypothetical protein